jgi:ferredoxin
MGTSVRLTRFASVGRCGRCEREKPLGEFAWRRKAKGQKDNYCRPCRAAYKREHYLANRDRYIQQAMARKRAMWAERVEYLVAYLRDNPCVDCGECDPVVLEFDHLRDKGSASPRAFATAIGRASSTRLQSARSFVQTVIDAEPLTGEASLARW